MLGRWVAVLEGRMFVQIAVVKVVNDPIDLFFKGLEVYAHAKFIQLAGPDCDFDLPVVAVRMLAVAGIIPQMVTAGKMGFYENIDHDLILLIS